MADREKNRFVLDDEFADDGEPIFLDEPDRKRGALRTLVTAFVILLALVATGGAGYYLFDKYYKPEGREADRFPSLLDKRLGQLDLDSIKDRFYIPEESVGPELSRAIESYRRNNREEARRELERFVDGDHPDNEKAIALVYSGIMGLEAERYAEAKHNLLRALRYNEKYVPALVNLAIAEYKMGNMNDARDYASRARDLSPGDPHVAVVLGNLLARSEDLPGAMESYREGLAGRPDDPALYYNLALSLLRAENYEEAILYFSKAIEKAGGGEIAHQSHARLGQIYFYKGNLETAADHLQRAVKLVPDNGRYQYNLGVIYLRLNRPEEAREAFLRALESGSDEATLYRGLAAAFEELEQPALAIRSLRKAVFKNPEDVAAWFMLGDLYMKENDLLSATEAYRKIAGITPGDTNTQDALVKLGRVYIDLERYNDASDTLREALRLNANHIQAKYWLGMALYRSGRIDMAVQIWREAVAERRDATKGPVLEREDERVIRFALANLYAKEGAFDLALQQLRIVEQRNTERPQVEEDPELEIRIAGIYAASRDAKNAVAFYGKVIDSRSADAGQRRDAHAGIARALLSTGRREDLDAARENAAKASRLDPSDYDISLLRAEILLKTESPVDRERAIELLAAVASSDVNARTASRAHNLSGSAYYKNGEYARALREFDYAVRLDPSNLDASENQRAAANAYEQSLKR